MADVEKKHNYGSAVDGKAYLDVQIDHEHAQDHKISPEDDARVRRKIDMVVLPMESNALPPLSTQH